MRMMLRLQLEAELGSEGLKSGAVQKAFANFSEKFKPEASYFTLGDGMRTIYFVFDMAGAHQLPAVCEAFFELGAGVEVIPAMNADDIKAGLADAGL